MEGTLTKAGSPPNCPAGGPAPAATPSTPEDAVVVRRRPTFTQWVAGMAKQLTRDHFGWRKDLAGPRANTGQISPELSNLIAKVVPDNLREAWFDTPNRTLKGKTPRQLLAEGREHEVIDSLELACSGGPSA